jgi:hypothetical protein
VDVVTLIAACALIVALLALARVVQLVARFGDDRGTALSHAFVVHGLACLALAGVDFVVDPLGLPLALQILLGLLTAAWGATWVLVGRAYDPDMSEEERAAQLAAMERDERGRQPAGAGRFERTVAGYVAERVERRG